MHRFTQLDVFTDELTRGNALAVVHDADDLSDEQMAAFARWTNLSETTFLQAPTDAGADYRVRIFTPGGELPFAGHPTLGSARAWLAAGGVPRLPEGLVQECGAGLVRVRREEDRLAFAAPALRRDGPVAAPDLAAITASLGLTAEDVVDAQWIDNGPPWIGLLLEDAAAMLALDPDYAALAPFEVGVAGPGGVADLEVRAFIGDLGTEDPVTGSLNAGLGQWLIGTGRMPASYIAAQGTRLGRRGRVHVDQVDGQVWVGGGTVVGIQGEVLL